MCGVFFVSLLFCGFLCVCVCVLLFPPFFPSFFLYFFSTGDNRDNSETFTLESESSPSCLPLLNSFVGFAKKKNKLNLVQVSPRAVLSLSPEGFRAMLHVCAWTGSFPADIQMWWKLQIRKVMADVRGWCLKNEWFELWLRGLRVCKEKQESMETEVAEIQ